MKNKTLKTLSIINIFAILIVIVVPFFVQKAEAFQNMALALVRIDRMATATPTTGTVCVNPTGTTGVGGKVLVTFPASGSWTVQASVNWTVDTTNKGWPATAVGWTGVGTGTASGQTVTFTGGGSMTNGTIYCFNWTSTGALTTGSAGSNYVGSIETQTSGSATVDKSNVAFAAVATGYDQVTINGTILPTFSYTLSATSANFTSIVNSVAETSSNPTVTIVTNAKNGWTAWVKDANNGTLISSSASTNIPIPGAVGGASYNLATMTANGAFGLGVKNNSGNTVPNAAYDGTSAGYAGTLSNAFQPMASAVAAATSDVIGIFPRAIAKVTQAPATDYTDMITIVAAGNF